MCCELFITVLVTNFIDNNYLAKSVCLATIFMRMLFYTLPIILCVYYISETISGVELSPLAILR